MNKTFVKPSLHDMHQYDSPVQICTQYGTINFMERPLHQAAEEKPSPTVYDKCISSHIAHDHDYGITITVSHTNSAIIKEPKLVLVSNSWPVCYEFDLSAIEDLQCRVDDAHKSLLRFKDLPFGWCGSLKKECQFRM
ncbi:hypothetical protein TNCV_563271 [Trichonephila clavipes]|nr:hypothetical protein TNCV_563271 [Trichonephila clavipes]